MINVQAPHVRSRRRRCGFTLVELLVVMAIIVVLFGITVALAPALQTERAVEGARQLSQHFEIAKNRSVRDDRAVGIRIIPDPTNPAVARGLMFITQPIPFTVPANSTDADSLAIQVTEVATGADQVTFHVNMSDVVGTLIQEGDYLQFNGGELRLLVSLDTATRTFTLSPPSAPREPRTSGFTTTDFKVFRSPQPIPGEELIELPEGGVISLAKTGAPRSQYFGSVGTPVDILFQGGRVVNQPGLARANFWLLDSTKQTPLAGEQAIVTIYTHTGVNVVHDVDLTGADPFSFTADLRNANK